VLVLKKNQGTLHKNVEQYFGDQALRAGSAYRKVVGKARSVVEVREYWQIQDIDWLGQRKEWADIHAIRRHWMVESYHCTWMSPSR